MVLAGLKSVSTNTPKLIISLVFFACVQAAWAPPVCTLTGWQLCARFQLSTERWVNCILSGVFFFRMSLPIAGSKADMSLALKLPTTQHQVPELLPGCGTAPGPAFWYKELKYGTRLSLKLLTQHVTLTPMCYNSVSTDCPVRCLCLAKKKKRPKLAIHAVFCWFKHLSFVKLSLFFPGSYLRMSSQLDTEHIPLLRVWAELVHIQSNHRLGSRSRH